MNPKTEIILKMASTSTIIFNQKLKMFATMAEAKAPKKQKKLNATKVPQKAMENKQFHFEIPTR